MKDDLARAQLLTDDFLDGVLTAEGQAELSALLIAHPSVAQLLARSARLDSDLDTLFRSSTAPLHSAPDTSGRPIQQRVARWVFAGAALCGLGISARVALHGHSVFGNAAPSASSTPSPAPQLALSSLPSAQGPSAAASQAAVAPGTRALDIEPGTHVVLHTADSAIVSRESSEQRLTVELLRGRATFDIESRDMRVVRVLAAGAILEVTGTTFTVTVEDDSVDVSVERGGVKITWKKGSRLLTDGERATFPREDMTRKTRGPASRTPDSRTPDLLRAAEDARLDGHPEDAVPLLRKFVTDNPRDPRVPYALFTLGRVLLEELKRPAEAASAFADAARLSQRSPLLEDALARTTEAWSKSGDRARARQAAQQYEARFPEGAKLSTVRRLGGLE